MITDFEKKDWNLPWFLKGYCCNLKIEDCCSSKISIFKFVAENKYDQLQSQHAAKPSKQQDKKKEDKPAKEQPKKKEKDDDDDMVRKEGGIL